MARTRSRHRVWVAAVMIAAAGITIWYWRSSDRTPEHADVVHPSGAPLATPVPPTVEARPAVRVQPTAEARPPAQPTTRAETPAAIPAPAVVIAATTQPASTQPVATPSAPAASTPPGASADAAAALAAGNLVQARKLLNQAVDPMSDSPANEQMIQQLTKLADEMIFSPKIVPNDPLVIKHIVEAGQTLQKIANLYKTTVPLICRVNHLSDPNVVRQGQPLKIVLGPFHATVVKHKFRMYVYCTDTLVKVFPVGLGVDESTPTGRWKIRNKLTNPPFYPPRGGKIIPAGDPANPLGGYWIGLEGLDGNAVGQDSYGIHGTNEPDTIGKNASLGCIRLRNEDVALLYELLVVHDSIVTVKD